MNNETQNAASDERAAARHELAQNLAREAGELALRYFRSPESFRVYDKGLQDQTTDADRAVEQLIRSRVTAQFPDDGWLGEETGRGEAGSTEFLWVVDPIDGTQSFLNQIPVWCVSIGVLERERSAVGVIYDPNADELFAACRGCGGTLNGRPICASTQPDLTTGVVGTGYSKRTSVAPVLSFIERLAARGGMFQRNGSGALMLAYVAAGRLMGYFEPHINAWDCLAGILLVEEAGGWCNDFLAEGGLEHGGLLLAAAPAVADDLRTIAGLKA